MGGGRDASGQAKKCWVRIVTTLTKLVERLAGPFEHEDYDEHEGRLIREAKPFSGKSSQENKFLIDSNTS
jgi:hypothetical protein